MEQHNQLIDFVENLIDENHTLSFKMKGNSMYPTLKQNDVGYVDKCQPQDVKVGDVVVFKVNQQLIAHRIIRINLIDNNLEFLARGDKNNFDDLPFTSDKLVGKVKSIKRANKTILLDSKTMKRNALIVKYFSFLLLPIYNFFFRLSGTFMGSKNKYQSLLENFKHISSGSSKLIYINGFISILQGIFPFILIIIIKLLIDQLSAPTLTHQINQTLIFLLIVTALVFLINGLLSEFKSYFGEKLSQSVSQQIYQQLHQKHEKLDLSYYESPNEQDKIHRAVQEASFRPIKMINEFLGVLKSIAAGLFLIALFITIRWYFILVIIVAILPSLYLRLKFSRKLYKLKKEQSTQEREMYYYNRILTGLPFAKELKLFQFGEFFKNRFNALQSYLFNQKIQLSKSELSKNVLAQVFSIVLIFLLLTYLAVLKAKGEISIGTVVLFFFAFQRGYTVLNEFFRSIIQLFEDNTFLNDYIAFLNLPAQSNFDKNVAKKFSLEQQIKIENLHFAYPTSKRDALKNINIEIPAGKTVAFVGANGSGKTSMIKMLCGFYEPKIGSISFDGVLSNNIGQKAICENITAVFQDFALYNILAFQNIALGNINEPLNLEKAKIAAQLAGIDSVLETLPNGYNTLLGNLFKTGEELSIGQWQKIAIARAFYRNCPLILMDEPSSALDADAELQILETLKKLSEEKTAIIVSHRLSSVRWVDLIFFFERGEIVEQGTHNELIAIKGKYYDLYLKSGKELN